MSYNDALDRMNYYGDSRTRESMRSHAYTVVEANREEAIILLNEPFLEGLKDSGVLPADHDGRFTLPSKYGVCPTCRGSGKVVNPSIDAGGLTREDFDEDPGFRDDYFSGAYDITCPECEGRRVVSEIDLAELPNCLGARVTAYQNELDDDLQTQLDELRRGA